jgi:lysophospholipase L1-like esterase
LGSATTEYESFYLKFSPAYNNTTFGIVNLPAKIYGVVGKEINIYLDNIVEDSSQYKFDVVCASGSQYVDRWTWTPPSAGTTALSINIYKDNQLVGTASTSVIVKSASVGNGVNRKCLWIGDSTTEAGAATGEVLTLFDNDVMDVSLLGSKGTAPNSYEATGGWTISNFVSSGSPFWISSALDFSAYMAAKGYTGVDRVIINLGINDIFSYSKDQDLNTAMATMITQLNTLINNIKVYDANIKFGIAITIPPSFSQDAFAASYGSGQTRWRYKHNLILWNKLLISTFGNSEASNIYLVPINLNLDTKNNMQTTTINTNARNTTQITVQSNGVHPANSGYYQIADIFYYWLKSLES